MARLQPKRLALVPVGLQLLPPGMVWYGMVWYGMVWYGMVWYGMVWYGVVWYGAASASSLGTLFCLGSTWWYRFW
jgi:hypothetical protein